MQLLVCFPGKVEPENLLNKEGVTQGDPLSVFLYGMILSVLVDEIRCEYPVFLQSLYSDDFSMADLGTHIKPDIACIEALGPAHGFFIGPGKSQFL